jgi:maleamate amidohydrolase
MTASPDGNHSLTSNYQAAGYHNRLGFGRSPALLVIDYVHAYFERSSPFYADVEQARDETVALIADAREAGVPVIFTRVVYQANGLDGGVFYRKVPALKAYLAGSELGRFADGIVPLPDELIIDKQYASAFFGTSLASTLHASGIDSVILAGLTTSGCVRASCVDALQHGFVPVVAADACGDRHPDPHRANLFDMSAKYADVIGRDEMSEYLRTRKPVTR